MKPTLILPRMAMSMKDMAELRKNGICVVEVSDPNVIKFVDVPLSESDLIERASVYIVRGVINGTVSLGWNDAHEQLKSKFARLIEEWTHPKPPPKPVAKRKPKPTPPAAPKE